MPEMNKDFPDRDGWRRMLLARPVRNASAKGEPASGGCLVVTVERIPPRWHRGLLEYLIPFRRMKRIGLDALGASVWAACDGSRTVGEIIEGFAEREALEWHEARLLVTGMLRSLIERGALAVALP